MKITRRVLQKVITGFTPSWARTSGRVTRPCPAFSFSCWVAAEVVPAGSLGPAAPAADEDALSAWAGAGTCKPGTLISGLDAPLVLGGAASFAGDRVAGVASPLEDPIT
jgi:hypothetical protein